MRHGIHGLAARLLAAESAPAQPLGALKTSAGATQFSFGNTLGSTRIIFFFFT